MTCLTQRSTSQIAVAVSSSWWLYADRLDQRGESFVWHVNQQSSYKALLGHKPHLEPHAIVLMCTRKASTDIKYRL
jgi:hypothetical protein